MYIKQIELKKVKGIGDRIFELNSGLNFIISENVYCLENFGSALSFLFGGELVRDERFFSSSVSQRLYELSESQQSIYDRNQSEKKGFDSNWADYFFSVSTLVDNSDYSFVIPGAQVTDEIRIQKDYNNAFKYYDNHEQTEVRLNGNIVSKHFFDVVLGVSGLNYSYQFPVYFSTDEKVNENKNFFDTLQTYFDITPSFAVILADKLFSEEDSFFKKMMGMLHSLSHKMQLIVVMYARKDYCDGDNVILLS